MHKLPNDVDRPGNSGEQPPTSCLHILMVSQINAFNMFWRGVTNKPALINAQNLVENVDFVRLLIFTAAFVLADKNKGQTLGDVELIVICGIKIWELPKIGQIHPLVRININDANRSSSG